MTPEQEQRQSELLADVAAQFGRLGEESVIELAMVSPELMLALDRLRDHYLEVRSGELD